MTIKLLNRQTEGELLLDGRLDALTAPEAEQILLQTAQRFDHLVLNMQGLQYISSAGLRVLKLTHMAMAKKSGTFVLTQVTKNVMDVLEMTGFASLLQIR